jgi:hypothetical protein
MAALSNLELCCVDQHRHITVRYVLLTLGFSAIFSTLYCVYLGRDVFFLSRDVSFAETPDIWIERAVQVKEAFRHAYHGYEQYAFPHDELLPVSNGSIDK